MPESLPGRKNGVCDNDLDFRNYGTALIPNRAIDRTGCGLTISVMRHWDKRQQRRAAKAVFDQAKFQYSQSGLRAFKEVSDALTASQKLSDIEEQQKHKVRALTESVAIANRRYRGGSPATTRFWKLSNFSIQLNFLFPRPRVIGGLSLSSSTKHLAAVGASTTHSLLMATDY